MAQADGLKALFDSAPRGSRSAVARLMGVTPGYITNVVNGHFPATGAAVRRITAALELHLGQRTADD